ncbi:MAG TPA: LytS/YhcK type 5TM receptor domain-containing protein [Negativicutes bacterium]|nr:LytS/YhcK type 5TM receptor domain-containing protein [Negativicutes bacterium]
MNVFLDAFRNIAVIAVFAYPITRLSAMQRAQSMLLSVNDKLALICVFGLLSICGNMTTTVVFNQAILNSGITGPVLGGIIAGPIVGCFSGLFGGLHRLTMGGFTAPADAAANVLGGILGGIFYWRLRHNRMNFLAAFSAGLLASIINLILILVLADPAILAFVFVKWTGFVTLMVNAFGIGIFTSIAHNVQSRQYSIGTSYAETATEIAQKTMLIIKGHMDVAVANDLADIIYAAINKGAVAISNGGAFLAFKGAGSETHSNEKPEVALTSGFIRRNEEYRVANSKREIACPVVGCIHDAVIVAPLYCGKERIGFLHVYKVGDVVHSPDIKLVTGVAEMLSIQFQSARLEEQAKLLAHAEYAALRSQINPHFLFNSISAIKLQVREDPIKAQQLLMALASFFRRTLESGKEMIMLAEELQCIEFYLTIQQARFGDRLRVYYDIATECMPISVPAFTIQPLVENCFNHGFSEKVDALQIKISGKSLQEGVIVRIEDNGNGIPDEVIEAVQQDQVIRRMGVGLTNVNRRLRSIYGQECALHLKNLHPGAVVELTIPSGGVT